MAATGSLGITGAGATTSGAPASCSVEALIVSFNTREELRQTLATLLRHPPPRDLVELRVSVIDNGSNDGSSEMVAREFPQVDLMRSQENLGFGRATNELAARSSADYLLLLNSDVIVTSDIITPLLYALGRDARAIAAGPRLLYPDGHLQYSACTLPAVRYECARMLRGTRLGRLIRPAFDSERIVESVHQVRSTHDRRAPFSTPSLWATCWLMRSADVASDGLFDPAFHLYDEDLDFCRRAGLRGRSLLYVPEAKLVHLGGASSPTSDAKAQRMRSAREQYYRRHHGAPAASAYRLAMVILPRLIAAVGGLTRPRRLTHPLSRGSAR